MISDLTALHATTRFSDRVANYVKYRPSYPKEIVLFLENKIHLTIGQRIADIGSGTGIFSELFLKSGYRVTGIEPNENMRKASEIKLGRYPGFTSRNNTAEQTGLRSHSVDLITVAQSFHRVEPVQTKKEFLRILKPEGHIVLGWNLRLKHTAFLRGYKALKEKFRIDYAPAKMAYEDTIKKIFPSDDCNRGKFSPYPMARFRIPEGPVAVSIIYPSSRTPVLSTNDQ